MLEKFLIVLINKDLIIEVFFMYVGTPDYLEYPYVRLVTGRTLMQDQSFSGYM